MRADMRVGVFRLGFDSPSYIVDYLPPRDWTSSSSHFGVQFHCQARDTPAFRLNPGQFDRQIRPVQGADEHNENCCWTRLRVDRMDGAVVDCTDTCPHGGF